MTDNDLPYRSYSCYVEEKYGAKTYKLPIKLPLTCPNRDGRLAYGGCRYCSEAGGSFENLEQTLGVAEQIKQNRAYLAQKYHATHFIAYFQNFTNTYMPLSDFRKAVQEAAAQDIVGIDISTRPDCCRSEYLDILKEMSEKHALDIGVELGVQTVNYKTLRRINRQHGLAEVISAVDRLHRYGFHVGTHIILGLPGDDDDDAREGASILSALRIDEVKIHALSIPKGSAMARDYAEGKLKLISLDDYIRRVILFLRYLSPSVVVSRLVGRMPEKDSVFCNWNRSWWYIRDRIVEEMKKDGVRQGDCVLDEGLLY